MKKSRVNYAIGMTSEHQRMDRARLKFEQEGRQHTAMAATSLVDGRQHAMVATNLVYLPRRERLPRSAKMICDTLANAEIKFIELLYELAEHSNNFALQNKMLVDAGTVRWSAVASLKFDGNLAKHPFEYVLQIRATSSTLQWQDWVIVKASLLPSGGMGLFAAQSFGAGQIISLYAGVPLENKTALRQAPYAISSIAGSLTLNAKGSMAEGYPPFIAAHMVNDPNFFAIDTVDLDRCNCHFDPDFMLVLTKDVCAHEELLVDYNRLGLK
jgi:hypothetical protein